MTPYQTITATVDVEGGYMTALETWDAGTEVLRERAHGLRRRMRLQDEVWRRERKRCRDIEAELCAVLDRIGARENTRSSIVEPTETNPHADAMDAGADVVGEQTPGGMP